MHTSRPVPCNAAACLPLQTVAREPTDKTGLPGLHRVNNWSNNWRDGVLSLTRRAPAESQLSVSSLFQDLESVLVCGYLPARVKKSFDFRSFVVHGVYFQRWARPNSARASSESLERGKECCV